MISIRIHIFVQLFRSYKYKKDARFLYFTFPIVYRFSNEREIKISLVPKFLRFQTRILLSQPQQRSPDIFTRIDTRERYIRISRSKKNLAVGRLNRDLSWFASRNSIGIAKRPPRSESNFSSGRKDSFLLRPVARNPTVPRFNELSPPPPLSLSLSKDHLEVPLFLFLFSFLSFSKSGIWAPSARIHACSLHTSK